MKRKPSGLSALWQAYINQPLAPSIETANYVSGLRAEVERLEIENARMRIELNSFRADDRGM